MSVFQLPTDLLFPHPELADEDGLLATGGDLCIERLILAYENGIFPWYTHDQPILWWSPPMRMVLYPGGLRITKSFRKTLEQDGFEIRFDTQFRTVVQSCARVKRQGQDGTWITDEMLHAYELLHKQGFAHSVECFLDERLVGGLYGLSLGRAFFGESMFNTVSNASKVAFHRLHQFILEREFHFIDCQLHTNHLASLGAVEIPRGQYLDELSIALDFPDLNQPWTNL